MKNILIIGASGGIGNEVSKDLVKDDHRIYATFYSNFQNNSNSITYHPLNVLDDSPDFSFLPEKLDALIYTPGSIRLRPFARIKSGDFLEDFELQLVGAVKTIQAALR